MDWLNAIFGASTCQKRLAKAQADLVTSQAQLDSANTQISTLSAQLSSCSQTVLDQNETIAGLTQSNSLLEATILDLQNLNEGFRQANAQLTDTILEMEEQITDLETQVGNLEDENLELQTENSDLTQQLDDCRNPPPPSPPVGSFLGSAPDFTLSTGKPLPTHVYNRPSGNINTWNKPLDNNTGLINMRFNQKPGTKITESIAAPILAGTRDVLIDQWIADIRGLSQTVLGTVWHEPLDEKEFLDSESRTLWGDVHSYVIKRFAAAGVTNVKWVPCLTGENYGNQGGDHFYTQELLDLCYAVGGDDYLENLSDPRPEADTGWMGHFNYHPEKLHVVLEWGLRDSFGVIGSQPPAFAEVTRFLKDNPNWVGIFGWFNKSTHDNRLNPDGIAALETMANDPWFISQVV